MSLIADEQKDLELMARLIEEIDEHTMYSIFYTDVLRSEKHMLRTEKSYIKDYLKSLKLIRPLAFIVTAVFVLIFFGIYSVGKGELLSFDAMARMLADIHTSFIIFFKSVKFDMSTVADFESAFVSVCDSLEGAYNEMALFINQSSLSASGMSDYLRYILYGDIAYITIFSIYDIYLIFATFKGFFKDTRKVRKFWKEKKIITKKEYAQKQLPILKKKIENKKDSLNELFYKYNLDKSLMNRENIKLLKAFSYDKKFNNATVKELERYIINTKGIQPTIETEEYAKIMLAKNERFPYYSKKNLASTKKREKKKNKDLLFVLGVIFWPITIYAFAVWYAFNLCKSILTETKTFTSGSISHNYSSTQYENNSASNSGYKEDKIKGPKYGYVDASGCWREPGEGYVDASGVWREAGEGYVDASGVWREAGEGYVDSTGVWREPGEGYVDASGVWREG